MSESEPEPEPEIVEPEDICRIAHRVKEHGPRHTALVILYLLETHPDVKKMVLEKLAKR